jgi:two-component system cell cycle response regulator CtrA
MTRRDRELLDKQFRWLDRSPPDGFLALSVFSAILVACRASRSCGKLRLSKVTTPALILSGLAGVGDKVKGLGGGADDYMTKPSHKGELLARIYAIVRETGDLVVNLDNKKAEINGQPVYLTSKEYQILELLALRKGTTVSKDMYLNHLYGGRDEPELKIIDVSIYKLRKKLVNASGGKDYIETVWGRGYPSPGRGDCRPIN